MSETPASQRRGGLFGGAADAAVTLLGSGRTRLELLGNELKEEKLRAVRLLLWSQLLAFCLAIGTVLLVALLVVVFWESRVVVLVCSIAVFTVCSALAYGALKRAMQQPKHLFASSLAELDEDRRQLQRSAGDESRAA